MKIRITSKFGDIDSMHKVPHNGIDIALPENTPLKSVTNGVVEKVTDYGYENIGTGIIIKSDNGHSIIYGHLNKVDVRVGDRVEIGELLGYSGNTGRSSGPHLHLGVHDGNKFIDGKEYVNTFEVISNSEIVNKSILNEGILNEGISNISEIYLRKSTQGAINSWLEYLENFAKAISEQGLNFICIGISNVFYNLLDILI